MILVTVGNVSFVCFLFVKSFFSTLLCSLYFQVFFLVVSVTVTKTTLITIILPIITQESFSYYFANLTFTVPPKFSI